MMLTCSEIFSGPSGERVQMALTSRTEAATATSKTKKHFIETLTLSEWKILPEREELQAALSVSLELTK